MEWAKWSLIWTCRRGSVDNREREMMYRGTQARERERERKIEWERERREAEWRRGRGKEEDKRGRKVAHRHTHKRMIEDLDGTESANTKYSLPQLSHSLTFSLTFSLSHCLGLTLSSVLLSRPLHPLLSLSFSLSLSGLFLSQRSSFKLSLSGCSLSLNFLSHSLENPRTRRR